MKINITQEFLKYGFNAKDSVDSTAQLGFTKHLRDSQSLLCSCLKQPGETAASRDI